MNPLRKLADPLLRTPPHPAPSMDALQARVRHRRDARRRQQLVAMSVFIVVLVGGVALAARQERGIETLTAPPGTTAGTSTTRPLAPDGWPVIPSSEVLPGEPAPPIEASPVELVFTPFMAPASSSRTLTITNRGDDPYLYCYLWDLRRWNGSAWDDVGSAFVNPETGALTRNSGHPVLDCNPVTVAAGASQSIAFDPGNAPYAVYDSNAPDHRPTTLEPGEYELFDSTARGRFVVTRSSVSNAPGTTSTTTPDRTPPTTVKLNPGTTLEQIHEILPTDLIAIDDDTIALSWNTSCNSPADHIAVVSSPDEIELRLSVGHFTVSDCMGEPDHWVVTFEVPHPIAGRPIVARADTDSGPAALERRFEAAPTGSRAMPVATPGTPNTTGVPLQVTSLLMSRDATGTVTGRLSYRDCWVGIKLMMYRTADGTIVPQAYSAVDPTTPCPASSTIPIDGDASTIFGAPPP